MFKISITQIDKRLEEEVVVKCHEIDDEVLSLVHKRKYNSRQQRQRDVQADRS